MSGSRVKAGEAYIEIGIRNRIAQGAKAVQRDLRNIGQGALQIGGAIGGLGLAISAPILSSVAAFASFDDAMRAVGGVTTATAAQLESMTEVAKELGRTTSFSATEVASLMGVLGRAGFSPDEVNEMTAAVLALSRATGTDATLSAGIMSATIRQFGLGASDAAKVSDVLTAAANNSFNSVESLGESMKYAGKPAKDLGLSLEETAAILGTLGNVGIQGSNAGTALRRLSIIGAAEVGKLEEIFGTGLRGATGEALPLVEMLGTIATATNNMGDGERAGKMAEAFGLLGITAASSIATSTVETGALLEKIKSLSGTAETTAASMDAGLGGSFRILSSAADGLRLSIGGALDESIQGIVETLTSAIGVASQFVDENQELIVAASLVSGGMIAAGAAAVTFGIGAYAAAGAIGVASTAAGIAGAIYGGFASVMAMVNAAVLATSAGIAFMGSTSTAAALGGALLNAAYGASPVVAGLVVGSFGAVGAVLTALTAPTALASSMAGLLGAAWTGAGAAAASAWAIIAGPILPAIAAGAAVVGLLGAAAGMAAYQTVDMGAAWTKLQGVLGGAVALVKDVGGAIGEALGSGDYATAAKALWLGLQIAFWEGAAGVKDAIGWMVESGWTFIKNFFSNMLDIAWETMKAVASAIMNPFQAANRLAEVITSIASAGTSIDFSSNADAVRAELASLRDDQQAASDQKEADELKSDPVKEEAKKDIAKIDRLEKAGVLTQEEADTQRAKVSERLQDEPTFGEDKPTAFEDKLKALQDEIFALENGAEAADLRRLAEDGLTEAEIMQIEVLKAKKKAIEDEQTAREKAAETAKKADEKRQEQRTEKMFEIASAMEEQGAFASDIFRATMAQINKDESSGLLSKENAAEARDRARGDLGERRQTLVERADEVRKELMTPEQKIDAAIAELKKDRQQGLRETNEMESRGLLTSDEANRRRAMLGEDFAEKRMELVFGDLEGSLDTNAPTAISSGFAASMLGGMVGANTEKQQVDLLRSIALSSEKTAKKDNVGRWA